MLTTSKLMLVIILIAVYIGLSIKEYEAKKDEMEAKKNLRVNY